MSLASSRFPANLHDDLELDLSFSDGVECLLLQRLLLRHQSIQSSLLLRLFAAMSVYVQEVLAQVGLHRQRLAGFDSICPLAGAPTWGPPKLGGVARIGKHEFWDIHVRSHPYLVGE